ITGKSRQAQECDKHDKHGSMTSMTSMTNTTNRTGGLAGKVALITGGSRGIGAAIARRLARDGAAVAVTYNASPEKAEAVVREIEAAGGRALAVRADSADVAAVRSAVATTAATFGGVDVLANNPATPVDGPPAPYPLHTFDRTLAPTAPAPLP